MSTAVVEISDRDSSSILAVELRDLLQVASPYRLGLEWSIIELEIFAKKGADINVLEIEGRCNNVPSGCAFAWQQLIELSDNIHQTIWCTLIGHQPSQRVVKYKNDAQLYAAYEIVLEIGDSSWARVAAKERAVIAAARQRFRDVKPVRLE